MSLLTVGSAIGNGMGALISGPLLDMNGALGLAAGSGSFWSLASFRCSAWAAILRFMPNTIADAKFLTADEKADVSRMIEPGEAKKHRFVDVLKAIGNPTVLGHGLIYTTVLTALYGVI